MFINDQNKIVYNFCIYLKLFLLLLSVGELITPEQFERMMKYANKIE